VREVLDLYEGTRRERANWILLQSRAQGEITQSADRDKIDRSKMPAANPILYDYDPARCPLEPDRVAA
jgi:hypothetical protein